jgi:glycerophosphoryl diester phosphodiesterase
VTLIGHRGLAARAPENTIASIEAAIRAGLSWIEFDVRLTADRVPVLLHDASLDRTTNGTGRVAELSLEDLRSVDAGARFDLAFAGERIPTLDRALDAIEGRATAVIEMKVDGPGEEALAHAVLRVLERRPRSGRHVLTSMDWGLLDGAAIHVPGIEIALTVHRLEPRDEIATASRTGAAAVHPHHTRVDERYVERAHAAGLVVRTYTVNDRILLERIARAGADAVFTDGPSILRQPVSEP